MKMLNRYTVIVIHSVKSRKKRPIAPSSLNERESHYLKLIEIPATSMADANRQLKEYLKAIPKWVKYSPLEINYGKPLDFTRSLPYLRSNSLQPDGLPFE